MSHSAEISVVVVTVQDYGVIRQTISCLRKQTIRRDVEIVIVAPSESALGLVKEDMEVFGSYQVVETGPIRKKGEATAAGIRAARAPIVALVEDHTYPHPGWAEALVAAHEKDYAAISPVFLNANPKTSVSWADFAISYGRWMDPVIYRHESILSGNNTSYKRDILLQYGEQLDELMEMECFLHWDLVATGRRLYIEPAAKIFYLNISRVRPWIHSMYYSGRLFAGMRRKRSSMTKRIFYIAASPFIAPVRLKHVIDILREPCRPFHLLPRILPALVFGIAVNAAGQMVGYLFGYGDSMEQLTESHFHRQRHLSSKDKTAQQKAFPVQTEDLVGVI